MTKERYVQIAVVMVVVILAISNAHYFRSYESAIEEDKKLRNYLDSLEVEVDSLNNSISIKEVEVSVVESKNDSLSNRIEGLDKDIGKIKVVYNDKIRNIDNLGTDSTIVLLSGFLSKEITY